jgi:hypothetical protein
MTKIFMTEDDLGEAAPFVLDPADESADPLAILLAAEEQVDDIFFAELERIVAERKSRRRGVEPNKPTRKASKRAVFH